MVVLAESPARGVGKGSGGMSTEMAVADHYTTGELFERVRAGLRAVGVDPARATVADLKAADEFHTGGVAATDHLMAQLEFTPGQRVLDVGSGIGGTSRYLADRHGAQVTGIDLTPEFVETARALSAMVGMGDATTFQVGSALDMPVQDATFDLAVLMHVGMNVADKAKLMTEIARALAPGGRLALFEVMAGASDVPLAFPLPWSTTPDTSFVAPPAAYRDGAAAAGLTLDVETDRTEFALDFFAMVFAKVAADGPAPLGIHLMMGETAPLKFQNYVANLKAGNIRPVEMIFTKGG